LTRLFSTTSAFEFTQIDEPVLTLHDDFVKSDN